MGIPLKHLGIPPTVSFPAHLRGRTCSLQFVCLQLDAVCRCFQTINLHLLCVAASKVKAVAAGVD